MFCYFCEKLSHETCKNNPGRCFSPCHESRDKQRGDILSRKKNDIGIREKAGLKYTDIMELPIFRELLVTSLSKLYRDVKRREEKIKFKGDA